MAHSTALPPRSLTTVWVDSRSDPEANIRSTGQPVLPRWLAPIPPRTTRSTEPLQCPSRRPSYWSEVLCWGLSSCGGGLDVRRVRITIETLRVTVSGPEPEGAAAKRQTEGSRASPEDRAGTETEPASEE